MNPLDAKIAEHFAGKAVRKDLVKLVKGNAIVPTYVLEYLLGQYCATSDEASILSGVESVKEILRAHYVHRNEAGLVRSTIREKGRHKVIDKVSADLNEKRDLYEAAFSNLGIKQVIVDTDTVKRHPKLLVSGVWCIADLEYQASDDKSISPYVLNSLKPIQLSNFDFDEYLVSRRAFSTDEWIDLLIQSIGFNPDFFSRRSKLLQLVRLIPYCERNYNLIELGPKGTGKSHIYSEFSPHGILISGGEVTVPKLFVNNSSGKIGLVGYWDVVAFDEFAGKKKRADRALVDILKNYMANKSFSRGIETLGAEASMTFVGNTQHTLAHMLRHSDLFDDLPEQYHDSAFLDRLHFYIPGWEMDIIRGEMFSDGYGFVVDYLAEILRNMRNHDYSHLYREHFTVSADVSTRDRTSVEKTLSGLMKVLYPHQEASVEEIEELVRFAMEGRKRVKDQLLRIDPTYAEVSFAYTNDADETFSVRTLEEEQYPRQYASGRAQERPPDPTQAPLLDGGPSEPAASAAAQADAGPGDSSEPERDVASMPPALREQHLTFQENQRGVSFDALFGPYLAGARSIVLTDPYIRTMPQARNLMELIETVARVKEPDEDVEFKLVTASDELKRVLQEQYYGEIQASAALAGIRFSWEFNNAGGLHARHIVTDTGWKILLDRGLDVFQYYEMKDAFAISNRLQQFRAVRAFEVTFVCQPARD
jgi:ATP-dependent Lon protease